MKNFKKIASAIAALSLAACMVAPVATMTSFAADPTYTITVPTEAQKDGYVHTYEAYQIFKGTYKAAGVETKAELTVTGWGSGVTSGSVVLEKLKAATFTSEALDFSKITIGDGGLTEAQAAGAVAQIISDANLLDDSEDAIKLAEVFAQCTSGTKITEFGEGHKVEAGYYLFVDKTTFSNTDNSHSNEGAYSRYILKVAGDVEVKAKTSAPSVEKKVLEDDKEDLEGWGKDAATNYGDDQYNDVADYSFGQDITFLLKGTLPEKGEFEKYKTYKYIFHDTLGSEFTLVDGEDSTFDINDITITIGGKELTDKTGVSVETSGTTNITISFTDIKDVMTKNSIATADDMPEVYVTYKAQLNPEKAQIGKPGQLNKVKLEYSNNPNSEGVGKPDSDDTGETPEDSVIVFTYELDGTKIDGATNKTLANATFTMKADNASTGADVKFKAVMKKDEPEKVDYYVVSNDLDAVTTITSDENGNFNIKGLDDGTYYLTETVAPDTYNKLTNPIKLVITATTGNTQDGTGVDGEGSALTALQITVDDADTPTTGNVDDGTVNLTVENLKGSSLPSTGGIGTTLFYLGGGALVAVAGVMLITKKRMTKE